MTSSIYTSIAPTIETHHANILVVDDDTTQLNFYKASLSPNFKCSFATNAKEALALAHRFPLPDLIILNIEMPDTDGFELCNALKSDSLTLDIPIIFVSAHGSTENIIRGFQSGCIDYITKPVLIPEMQARIDTHVKLRKQARQVERLSYIDSLTGVPNRRKYNETMLREWQRCCRYGQSLALIVLDIDYFKQFNDFYGHSVGDEALTRLANCFVSLVNRPGDLFARLGGEEFVLLLTDCDRVGASLKADEAIKRLAMLNIENQGAPRSDQLTISMGLAICVPKRVEDPLHLFQAADEALYRAKQSGKNKWLLSETMSGSNVTKIRPGLADI